MTSFNSNPYATDDTFPYFDSKTEVFSPTLSNSSGEDVTPSTDLSYGFKGVADLYSSTTTGTTGGARILATNSNDPALVCIN